MNPAMKAFLRRGGLSLFSLVLLSLIIFFVVQVMPGDVGRRILGSLADQRSVDKLNEALGVNRPVIIQYLDWAGHFISGDFGTSFVYREPVAPLVMRAFSNSLLLAAVSIALALPLSVVMGLLAARNDRNWAGGVITVSSVVATAIPEFVVGVVLLIIFGVTLAIFPTSADVPTGSTLSQRLWALILPSATIALTLGGYLTRVVRARAREVYLSDYVRFARTLGSSEADIFRQNVLANSIVPAIPVVATQIGYLIGSLTVVELLFNYDGLGLLILNASRKLDLPMLMASVLVSGIFFMTSILVGDALVQVLDPRRRLR